MKYLILLTCFFFAACEGKKEKSILIIPQEQKADTFRRAIDSMKRLSDSINRQTIITIEKTNELLKESLKKLQEINK